MDERMKLTKDDMREFMISMRKTSGQLDGWRWRS